MWRKPQNWYIYLSAILYFLASIEPASASDEENFLKLKRLFSINNNLLRELGVSHPVLEKIFSIAERLDFSAKLTGAGAGGFAIILLPPAYKDSEAFQSLCRDFRQYETHITTIGGPGLQINQ